ncbi:MAG: transposase [Evtepia gabavorous]
MVSYTISDRPDLKMVTSMLEKAFHKIPDGTNLILHSDQGWHYQHRKYRDMLKGKDIRQSMSRKGNCLDNAVVENFFGLLKSELLYLQKFASIEQFKTELVSYLEYYNNRRIKLSRAVCLQPFIDVKPLALLESVVVVQYFGCSSTFEKGNCKVFDNLIK